MDFRDKLTYVALFNIEYGTDYVKYVAGELVLYNLLPATIVKRQCPKLVFSSFIHCCVLH